MANVHEIRIEDFNYPLSDEQIAKHPLAERDKCKLLLYRNGEISEHVFNEIAGLLPEKSTLVYNNTRVINARLRFASREEARSSKFSASNRCSRRTTRSRSRRPPNANGSASWATPSVGNQAGWKCR